jgi:hypothetical protein
MPHHRMPNVDSPRRRPRRQRIVLPLNPALTEAELLALFERGTDNGLRIDALLALVNHPATSDSLLRRILESLWLDYTEAWNALAAVPKIQRDPDLRRCVVCGASAEGFGHLAPHCSREDWGAIFSRITDPRWPTLNESALCILSLATPEQLEGVGPDIWVTAALQRVSLPGLDLLAYLPGAWRDPRVQKRLEEFGDVRAIASIISHTQDLGLASRLFRRLGQTDAHAAAALLRDCPQVAAKLARSDLRILFTSGDREVRESAFHALQYLPSNT